MAEISIWSAAIIVMLMMFAASIGFVAAGILAGARSVVTLRKAAIKFKEPSHAGAAISCLASSTETTIRNTSYIIPSSRKSE